MSEFDTIFKIEKGVGDVLASVGKKVGRAVATTAHVAAQVVVPGYHDSDTANKYEQGMKSRSAAKDRAQATKPPAGFIAIPGSEHGGFHKRVGDHWETWYPNPQAASNKEKHDADEAMWKRDKTGATHGPHDISQLANHHMSAKHAAQNSTMWHAVADEAEANNGKATHWEYPEHSYTKEEALARAKESSSRADGHRKGIEAIEQMHPSLQRYSNALRVEHKTADAKRHHAEVTHALEAESEKARNAPGGMSVADSDSRGGVAVAKAGRTPSCEFARCFGVAPDDIRNVKP